MFKHLEPALDYDEALVGMDDNTSEKSDSESNEGDKNGNQGDNIQIIVENEEKGSSENSFSMGTAS